MAYPYTNKTPSDRTREGSPTGVIVNLQVSESALKALAALAITLLLGSGVGFV